MFVNTHLSHYRQWFNIHIFIFDEKKQTSFNKPAKISVINEQRKFSALDENRVKHGQLVDEKLLNLASSQG